MENKGFSRRGFLKTLSLAGAAMAIEPSHSKVQAASRVVERRREAAQNTTLPYRTLGTGNAAFEVSHEEWRELETAVAAIPVMGDHYNAEQQRQVGH